MITRTGSSIAILMALALLGPAARAQDKLKIGFISTLSSPASSVGPELRDGFRLAIKDLDGKLGGRDVDLVIGDDQMKPDVGVQLAHKMMDEDKVQLITGVVLSNITLAVAHAVLPRKTFMLSLNAGPSQLAGPECNPYFFAVSYQNDQPSEGMGLYLDKKAIETASLIAANYAAGRDFLSGFKRTFKGKIVSETYTPLDQFDFAAELAEIRAANPEAVFFFYTSGAPSINLVKQFAEAGLKGKIALYGLNFSLDEQTLPGMGDAAVGVEDATLWNADLDNPQNRTFVAHFKAAYNRMPSIFASFAYDGAHLLDSALHAVDGHIERQDEFRKAMEAAKFASVRGAFRFGNNHFPIQNVYLAQIERDSSGTLYNAYRSLIVADLADSYAGQCKMR